MMILNEGGNAIKDSEPVNREDVATVIELAKKAMPIALLKNLHTDIGSAGYKAQSGDIDLMVDASDVIEFANIAGSKDPTKEAKQVLSKFFDKKGIEAVPNGRNVSIGIVYTEQSTKKLKIAQVDVMVINDVAIVAPYHQHGLRNSYEDPDFKGSPIFILMNSIGKSMNLKFDAFGAKLMNRDDNSVVARTRDEVAKILLNQNATGNDLNSVKSIMRALFNDPNKEAKLAQAREDAKKGLITLPESVQVGSPVWFSQMKSILLK
jgi:hypothetical protein